MRTTHADVTRGGLILSEEEVDIETFRRNRDQQFKHGLKQILTKDDIDDIFYLFNADALEYIIFVGNNIDKYINTNKLISIINHCTKTSNSIPIGFAGDKYTYSKLITNQSINISNISNINIPNISYTVYINTMDLEDKEDKEYKEYKEYNVDLVNQMVYCSSSYSTAWNDMDAMYNVIRDVACNDFIFINNKRFYMYSCLASDLDTKKVGRMILEHIRRINTADLLDYIPDYCLFHPFGGFDMIGSQEVEMHILLSEDCNEIYFVAKDDFDLHGDNSDITSAFKVNNSWNNYFIDFFYGCSPYDVNTNDVYYRLHLMNWKIEIVNKLWFNKEIKSKLKRKSVWDQYNVKCVKQNQNKIESIINEQTFHTVVI